MTKLISLAVIGTVACAAVYATSVFDTPSSMLYATNSEFARYATKYGKSYGTVEEYRFREQLFLAKKAALAKENAKNGNTFTVGLNQFSDWTSAEYKRLLGYKRSPASNRNYVVLDTTNLTDDIDWNAKGAVTGVKN